MRASAQRPRSTWLFHWPVLAVKNSLMTGLPRQGLNELLGVRGHDDLYLGAGFDEQPCERGTLVGGDSARDTQDDVLAFQHDALFLS